MAERAVGEIDVRHSEAEEAYLESLYAELEPEARLAYASFFLSRTPAHLQEDMKALVVEKFPNPPDAPEASPENFGAPRSQRVDVEAIAQAAGHAAGADEARAAREAAMAARTLNPGNPTKPLVNIEPGPDGPVIVAGPAPAAEPAPETLPDSYEQPRL